MIIFELILIELLQKRDNFPRINARVTYNVFILMMYLTFLEAVLNVRMSAKKEISKN